MTGVFAATTFGGTGFGDGSESTGAQVFAHFVGAAAIFLYIFIVRFVILKILDSIMGIRANPDEEEEGLAIALHDGRGYIL